MASSNEFVNYICEQIAECGSVRSKKMFGEYLIYLNEKPIFIVCNDNLYVKILKETTEIVKKDSEQGFPYNGAKPHYIVDEIEDKLFLERLASAVEKVTPQPRKKKAKSEK